MEAGDALTLRGGGVRTVGLSVLHLLCLLPAGSLYCSDVHVESVPDTGQGCVFWGR